MIGLFFGSSTGATAAAAQLIQSAFVRRFGVEVELFDVADYFLEEMAGFDYLIVGIPTWNIGQLQRDWENVIEEFDELDLSGKHAALFGLGDQAGYPGSFVDAMIFLADLLEARGATLAGAWPTDGYTFIRSWAVRDGRFVGLVLDEDNQPELTPGRVEAWVSQLGREWMLAPAG
ncbi:MAG: flavodoxin [Chloroflexi bacterium]|nr:MAG: flavodoxin [Chloroflexota bacterium]